MIAVGLGVGLFVPLGTGMQRRDIEVKCYEKYRT